MTIREIVLGNKRVRQLAKRLLGHTGLYTQMAAQQAAANQKRLCAKYFPDLRVAGGPFAGLKYPAARASGSSFLPKLAGLYECELHDVFDTIIKQPPVRMVDVGCAEGFYAVGMARAVKSLCVEAYDIDPYARKLCEELARENDVTRQVEVFGAIDAKRLSAVLRETPGVFVLSDCEGFELQLFEGIESSVIKSATLLIECHDHVVGLPIAERLCSHLKSTHEVALIRSLPDHERVRLIGPHSPYRDSRGYDRHLLTSEGRGAEMQWIFAIPAQSR